MQSGIRISLTVVRADGFTVDETNFCGVKTMVGRMNKALLRSCVLASLVVVSACGRSSGEQLVYDNCMATMSDKKLCDCTADAFGEHLNAEDLEWLAGISEDDAMAFGAALMASYFGDGDPEDIKRLKRLEIANKKAEQCL